MAQKSLHSIKETYKRRRLAFNIMSVLFLLFFVSFLLLVGNLQNEIYLSGIFFVSMLLLILTFFFTPVEIDTYHLMRYHVSELIISVRQNNVEKSLKHINLLSKYISQLNNEIDTITVFNDTRVLFNNLITILRYQIYPNLLNNTPQDVDLGLLDDIDKAINSENFDNLKNIANIKTSTPIPEELMFPCERPTVVKRIIQRVNTFFIRVGTGNLIKNKYLRFVGSFCLFIAIIPFFVVLDSSLMVAIIGASIVIAKGF